MLFFVVSCFSFILLSKYSFIKAIPALKSEMGFTSLLWFSRILQSSRRGKISISSLFNPFMKMGFPSKLTDQEVVVDEKERDEDQQNSLLDLPDLALECILERLSPAGLSNMSGVCRSLRGMCIDDHLWEKHLKRKWGNLMGDSAHKEWLCHIASKKKQETLMDCSGQKGFFGVFTRIFPLSWRVLKNSNSSTGQNKICLPVDSIMSWYLTLESGNFSFPAQVYNRENGNVGFLLSCYDAKVSYDSNTNSFTARYSAHGRPTTEENIEWDRLRAPVVETSSHDLHISDCLNDLQPGDHIEIQWRKSKEFPYGWWYGVVGHLESCDGNKLYCQCHCSETVMLEFKQYTPGSRWREVAINRKDHREVGNEADGFYAGIRKLSNEHEISTWKRLWPAQPLE